MYYHTSTLGEKLPLPVGKVVCVGRNYLDHIKELGNEVPEQALLFIKPSTAVCDMRDPLHIPTDCGECHNELEIAFLIGQPLTGQRLTDEDVITAIVGIGLGLDLTLRNVQNQLKQAGQPWERAKAFDGSCPLSPFVASEPNMDLQDLHFSLRINRELRQRGHSALMMRSVVTLIKEMASLFSLQPGDVVLTGTPKGVGPLSPGDRLDAELHGYLKVQTRVNE